MELGCIADDFTGATDLAGILARSGARVSLRIGVPGTAPADPAPFEVIALKIRTAPREEAVAEARAALAWLRGAGAVRAFWKYCSTFDSTPQGNIGPVADALMETLGTTQTIHCPAFPENGRRVFMGRLFVGQDPLAESPMKDHPLTPMRDSNLMRLLAPQVQGAVGLVDWPTVAQGPAALRNRLATLTDTPHAIVDAVSDADLATIAEACRDMTLLCGGSALALPLPALFGVAEEGARPAPPSLPAGAVVLSGSCSAMTRAQVAAHSAAGAPAHRLDPLSLADGTGEAEALAWLAAQDPGHAPMVYATAEPAAVAAAQAALGPGAGALVEATLARLAVAARDRGIRRIVVAGGETAGAVTRALGVDRLEIGREIAPGVPWTFASSGGGPIALALKSGNFGAAGFFADALRALDVA